MTVLVTSAGSPKALTVIRSLGRKGISCTTASDSKKSLGSASRYSQGDLCYPSPVLHPDSYISAIREFLKENPHEMLFPVHSDDTYLIAKHKQTLEKYTRIPLHDYPQIKEINDKGRLMETARKLDVPIPATYSVSDLDSMAGMAKTLIYPVVIKVRNSSGSHGVLYATSAEELESRYRFLVEKFRIPIGEYPIIQEYIQGEGYGVSVLYNKGEFRARCTHRRLREYPISGGPSTLRESTVNREMEQIAETLLEHYRWHGVAMVEFKQRESDKKPFLLEVNPRIWGSINQSIVAGVDFPHLLYKMMIDGDVEPVLKYKTGVQSRNSFADALAMGSYLLHTGKINNFWQTKLLPLNDDIISLDDPKPILRFLVSGFGILKKLNFS